MSQAVKELSSEELFELAKKRKAEEEAKQHAEAKKVVDQLRADRREIMAKYNKELKAVDSKINKLTGRSRKSSGGARTPGISAKILEIVKSKGKVSSKEINAQLVAAGIEAKNLSQTMAYLKKKGDVVSVGHGQYAVK